MSLVPVHKNSVGVVKEVKDQENRVGLTPAGCAQLVDAGHKVFVQRDAGVGSGFSDKDYLKSGAMLLDHAAEVAGRVDILVKVKEPLPNEFYWLKELAGKTLFTFLHLADNPDLAKVLLRHKITGVSYDTIEDSGGRLPLLTPMSRIAGEFAVSFWEPEFDSVKNILVVGGGVTGEAAIQAAVNYDVADIDVYEKSALRARQLEKYFYDDPVDVTICEKRLPKLVKKADLIIGAVLVKGAKCPVVVTEEMLKEAKPGVRITDVSIDQGGCIFGSRPTSHSNPTFELDGRSYCCIPNMPGYYPQWATEELTSASLPFLLGMAKQGVFQFLVQEPWLIKGINTHDGMITNKTIARDLSMLDRLVEL